MTAARSGAWGAATSKGDLLAPDASNVLDRLPVGVDGAVLTADSTKSIGLAWSVAPAFTTADMDLYLSTTGNDAADGRSIGAAVQTPERIDQLIPETIDHVVRIHVNAGTYVLTRSYIFRERNIRSGTVRVFADEAWNPGVYNIDLTGAAAAGTNDSRCVTAGLVANAQRGRWLRFTDGDAVNQWRTIQGNTTTDLVPCDIFGYYSGLVPAPGDTFEVCSPNVIFQLPGDTCRLTAGTSGSAAYYGSGGFNFPCWQWEGLGLEGDNMCIPAMHFLVGVTHLAGPFFGNTIVDGGLVAMGAVIGGSAPYGSDDLGHQWGFTCLDLYNANAGWFYGTLVARTVRAAGWWGGGHVTTLEVGYNNGIGETFGCEIAYFPYITQTVHQVVIYNAARLLMGWAAFVNNAGVLLTCVDGGVCVIDHAAEVTGATTGATTVSCARGGTVYMDEAPALGKAAAALDWQNGDGVGVNKAAFVAGFAHLFRLNNQERA